MSIICFSGCYAITLALEISRFFFRARARTALSIGIAAAGLLAHTLYLYDRTVSPQAELALLGSWYYWALSAAWVLSAVYLAVALARPRTPLGIFVMPLLLGLIGVAQLTESVHPVEQATEPVFRFWGMVHGIAFLAAVVVVLFGFIAGLMYLIQANRLKQKKLPSQRLRLPSLEWLARANGRTVITSAVLMGLGILAGVFLNVAERSVPFVDPAVWASCVMFAWLSGASLVETFYKPVSKGRKVAYLTLAGFVFLLCMLGIVLFGSPDHTRSGTDATVVVGKEFQRCDS